MNQQQIISDWQKFSCDYDFYMQVRDSILRYISIRVHALSIFSSFLYNKQKELDIDNTYKTINSVIQNNNFKQLDIDKIKAFMNYFKDKDYIEFGLLIQVSKKHTTSTIKSILESNIKNLKISQSPDIPASGSMYNCLISKKDAYELYTLLKLKGVL